MKKKILFLMALLAVSLLALAEMSIFVYQKDGAKVEYLAANVDSIGFVNIYTITFDANGGEGSMEALRFNEGESVLLPVNKFTEITGATFNGWNTMADGTGEMFADGSSVSLKSDIILYAQWYDSRKGYSNGYEYVDLGLPSGTLWASMNVGATSIEDEGDLFAWGETEPKETYTWSTYKFGPNESNPTKYAPFRGSGFFSDNIKTLLLEDDAAHINWGGKWRMPTDAEFNELINNCTSTVKIKNGVTGYLLESKINGAQIFMPGFPDRSYWSSSLFRNEANHAIILWGHYVGAGGATYKGLSINKISRAKGNLIRPVLGE